MTDQTARTRRALALYGWVTKPGVARLLLRLAIVLVTWPPVAAHDVLHRYSPRGRWVDGWHWARTGQSTNPERNRAMAARIGETP